MQSILLDPRTRATKPEDHRLIETEVAFLTYAISGESLFIRGSKLCSWAKEFFDGRSIPTKDALSPVDDLTNIFASMSLNDAQRIYERIRNKIFAIEQLTALNILEACFPIPLWASTPSRKHAAEWLLWLDEIQPEDAFKPILDEITNNWKNIAPEFHEIYNIHTVADAQNMLSKWLGSQITEYLTKLGSFPLVVPERWICTLQRSWQKEILRTDGSFLSDFIKTQTPWEFKQKVAIIALDYFSKNPSTSNFTTEVQSQIARYVTGSALDKLNAIKPIPRPGNIPESPEKIADWFLCEYIPFRVWQVSNNSANAYEQAIEIGNKFSRWYLDFYPKALIQKKYLSFFKSKQLKEKNNSHVDLLVVLDGLNVIDSKIIKNALLEARGNHKLEMIENSVCFSPLPTVTDFAKGALLRGVQPNAIKDFDLLGEDVSENQTPLPKLQKAQPGSFFIWRIQDPDTTYHTKNDSQMLRAEVEGELRKIAQKINEIVENVPSTIPLRLTVTTDHGRFLGKCLRTVPVPHGMKAHGRAAWGTTNISFDKTGYMIDGELAYLSSDRYGLMQNHVAVILSDRAFVHDRFTQEISPHGGLFPEEVILPWMVFIRDIARPDLDLVLSGEGQANIAGKAILTISNPSSIDLLLDKLELLQGTDLAQSIRQRETVPGYKTTKINIDLSSWPSSAQKDLGKSHAIFVLPSGEELVVKISMSDLKVMELYTRDKSLFEEFNL